MSADPNMGFHFDGIQASALSRHAISFESGAINSTSGLVSVGSSVGANSTTGMIMAGNSSMINNNHGISQIGNSAGGLLLDSAMGLKHDTGFAVEWSTDEQSRLEQGLVKFGDEPTILRYIKIAAILRDKTVRDVALRCRWMTNERIGKRRKPEEHHTGRKMKDRKETLVESSKANVPRAPLQNLPVYSLMAPRMDKNERISCEVPAVSGTSGTTRLLLDENAEVFSLIMNNLSTFKLQENIDLLYRTRNNIVTILNNMRGTPGIMSQMPPLPVTINEDLANSILPNAAQAMMFGSPSGIHLKQEPRC